jgi:sorbitol-specific phosphotransferase system component IIC
MSPAKKAWLSRLLIVLLIAYSGFLGFIWWAMRQPPEKFARVMARMPVAAYFVLPFETMWTHARAGTLNMGDAAPDFLLTKLDKTDKIQLSSLTARQPVVLVFGSYT